jgi:hypothetical protein
MNAGHLLIDFDDFWDSHERGIFSSVLLFVMLSTTAAFCENKGILSLIFSGGASYVCVAPNEPVDAVTSASRWGGNGGIHAEIDLAGHFIETGLDYSYFKNDYTYNNLSGNIDGTRSFTIQGITLPVMYNFHFFNRGNGDPRLILGLGLFGSYFPYHKVGETGSMSSYNLKNWTAGPCLRISYYPLEIEDKYLLGLFLGLSRSINGFYTDDYYKGTNAGNLGFLDLGINLKMRL